jgi:type IV secretory pathway TrbF-like protein
MGWMDRNGDATDQYKSWVTVNNPVERAAHETVGVTIESVGAIGADTWQVDWSEEHRSRDGMAAAISYWRATIRIKIDPPTDEATIIKDPAGIYIEWFSVTPRTR